MRRSGVHATLGLCCNKAPKASSDPQASSARVSAVSVCFEPHGALFSHLSGKRQVFASAFANVTS